MRDFWSTQFCFGPRFKIIITAQTGLLLGMVYSSGYIQGVRCLQPRLFIHIGPFSVGFCFGADIVNSVSPETPKKKA